MTVRRHLPHAPSLSKSLLSKKWTQLPSTHRRYGLLSRHHPRQMAGAVPFAAHPRQSPCLLHFDPTHGTSATTSRHHRFRTDVSPHQGTPQIHTSTKPPTYLRTYIPTYTDTDTDTGTTPTFTLMIPRTPRSTPTQTPLSRQLKQQRNDLISYRMGTASDSFRSFALTKPLLKLSPISSRLQSWWIR